MRLSAGPAAAKQNSLITACPFSACAVPAVQSVAVVTTLASHDVRSTVCLSFSRVASAVQRFSTCNISAFVNLRSPARSELSKMINDSDPCGTVIHLEIHVAQGGSEANWMACIPINLVDSLSVGAKWFRRLLFPFDRHIPRGWMR